MFRRSGSVSCQASPLPVYVSLGVTVCQSALGAGRRWSLSWFGSVPHPSPSPPAPARRHIHVEQSFLGSAASTNPPNVQLRMLYALHIIQ